MRENREESHKIKLDESYNNWLISLLLKEQGYILNKQQFWHVKCI